MRSYTVASVWGIPIRVNVSLIVFLPILAWIIGSGTQIETYASLVDALSPTTVDVSVLTGGSNPWLIGVAAAVGLFVSVALHELGHAWAARRYGIGTRDITLWLLGGIASLERMPREWNQELWIALAGPATSVATAVGCYAVLLVLPASTPVTVFVFGWLVVMNLVLTVYNLLPAFPMDGGQVLRALLARSRSYESATRTAARLGTGFAVLVAVVGVVTLEAFRGRGQADRDETPVRTIADTDVPRIAVSDDAFDGLTAVNTSKSDVALVESDGDVVGVVSVEEFGAFLQFRKDGVGLAPRTAL
jgi:Zn-dependent protease